MRILYIGDDPTTGSGLGRVSKQIISKLQDRHEILHAALNYRKSIAKAEKLKTHPNVKTIMLAGDDNDHQGYFRLDSIIGQFDPDVIITHNDLDVIKGYYEGIPHISYAGSSLIRQYPVVAYPPIDTVQIPEGWKTLANEKNLYLISPTEFGESLLREAGFQMFSTPVMWEESGATIEVSDSVKERNFLKLFGKPKNDNKLGIIVCRNDARKNVAPVLGQLNKFVIHNKNWYFIIKFFGFGQGGLSIDQINQSFPNLVQQSRIITETLSDKDMAEIYASGDVYLHLSLGEGWGHGPIDAAKQGTPTIATDFPVTREVMGDHASYVSSTDIPEFYVKNTHDVNHSRSWKQPDLEKLDMLMLNINPDLGKNAKEWVKRYDNVDITDFENSLLSLVAEHEIDHLEIPDRKPRIMFCGDSPEAYTGYGTVLREIMTRLHATNKYTLAAHSYFHRPNMTNIKMPFHIYSTAEAADAIFGNDQNRARDKQDYFAADHYGNRSFDWVVEQFKPDVVVSVGDMWYATHAAASKHRSTYKHYIYLAVDGEELPKRSIHGSTPVDTNLPGTSEINWDMMVRTFDKVIVFTNFAKDEIHKAYGDVDVEIIPHGVNSETYHPIDPDKRKELRRKYNLNDNVVVIGTFSRNQVRKQFDIVVQTMAKLIRREPYISHKLKRPIKFVWAPYCSWRDPKGWDLELLMSNQIIDKEGNTLLSRALKLADTNNQNKGVSDAELNELYNVCDFHLLPSIGEGWGLCVDSETIVDTIEGSIPIKNVEIGTQVIGMDGKFHKVLDKTTRTVDETFEVYPMTLPPIIVTPEHPFYVKHKDDTEEWVNVSDIRNGDMLGIVKPLGNKSLPSKIDLLDYLPDVQYDDNHVWYKLGYSPSNNEWSYSYCSATYGETKKVIEKARRYILSNKNMEVSDRVKSLADRLISDGFVNPEPIKVNRFIEVNKEFLNMVGWYLSEGSSERRRRLNIDLHADEINVAEHLADYFKLYFGVDNAVVSRRAVNKSSLRIGSKVIATFMEKFCGKGAFNKHIPDIFIGSERHLLPMFEGYVNGDGCISKKKRYIRWSTVSTNLAFGMRNILLCNNILSSLKVRPIRGVGVHKTYECSVLKMYIDRLSDNTDLKNFSRDKGMRKMPDYYKENNSHFFIPIRKIDKIQEERLVIDLHVEDSHSFVAGGMLVHNTCTESFAAGLPFITTDFSAIPSYSLINEERGKKRHAAYLIKPRIYKYDMGTNIKHAYVSPDDIANEIEKLVAKPKLVDRLRNDGLTIAKKFSWDNTGNLFDKALEDSKPIEPKVIPTKESPISIKDLIKDINPETAGDNVLIIDTGGLADTIMLSGIITGLKDAGAPNIYVATGDSTRKSIIEKHPGVKGAVVIDVPIKSDLDARLFGLVIDTSNLPRNWENKGKGPHKLEVLARTIGIKLSKPFLPVDEFDISTVGLNPDEPIITIETIQVDRNMRWQHWEAFVKMIYPNIQIVQVGEPHGPSLDFMWKDKRVFDARVYNIEKQAGIMKHAKMHVGINGPMMHYASYLDKPQVILWMQGGPGQYGPLYVKDDHFDMSKIIAIMNSKDKSPYDIVSAAEAIGNLKLSPTIDDITIVGNLEVSESDTKQYEQTFSKLFSLTVTSMLKTTKEVHITDNDGIVDLDLVKNLSTENGNIPIVIVKTIDNGERKVLATIGEVDSNMNPDVTYNFKLGMVLPDNENSKTVRDRKVMSLVSSDHTSLDFPVIAFSNSVELMSAHPDSIGSAPRFVTKTMNDNHKNRSHMEIWNTKVMADILTKNKNVYENNMNAILQSSPIVLNYAGIYLPTEVISDHNGETMLTKISIKHSDWVSELLNDSNGGGE